MSDTQIRKGKLKLMEVLENEEASVWWWRWSGWVGTGLVMVVVVSMMPRMVAFANDATPRDWYYPLDLAMEWLTLQVTPQESRETVTLSFESERRAEMGMGNEFESMQPRKLLTKRDAQATETRSEVGTLSGADLEGVEVRATPVITPIPTRRDIQLVDTSQDDDQSRTQTSVDDQADFEQGGDLGDIAVGGGVSNSLNDATVSPTPTPSISPTPTPEPDNSPARGDGSVWQNWWDSLTGGGGN
jgi:hypothetical protein